MSVLSKFNVLAKFNRISFNCSLYMYILLIVLILHRERESMSSVIPLTYLHTGAY